MNTVTILGAKGRFGRAATQAFLQDGWTVRCHARSWTEETALYETISCDVRDKEQLTRLCQGSDVIVNAVNPAYPAWGKELPLIDASVIAAGKATGATVMIPGNVYNYGEKMPSTLTEQTPWRPTSKKGCLRVQMENRYRMSGVQTIVLRGGDFIEAEQTGNWFDTYIANKAWSGQVTYPGPMDVPHAWAYLPDMARTMAGLAAHRDGFEQFEEFGLGGFTLTGAELVAAIGNVVGQDLKVKSVPWTLLRLLGLVNPMMREVGEMAYLWRKAHGIDDTKLRSVLPDLHRTPMQDAIAASLPRPGNATREALSFSERSA